MHLLQEGEPQVVALKIVKAKEHIQREVEVGRLLLLFVDLSFRYTLVSTRLVTTVARGWTHSLCSTLCAPMFPAKKASPTLWTSGEQQKSPLRQIRGCWSWTTPIPLCTRYGEKCEDHNPGIRIVLININITKYSNIRY